MLSWSLVPSRVTPHCPEPDSRAALGIGIPRLSHQGHQGLCSKHRLYSCRIWSFPGSLPRQSPDSEPGPGEINAGLDKRCLRVCLSVCLFLHWLAGCFQSGYYCYSPHPQLFWTGEVLLVCLRATVSGLSGRRFTSQIWCLESKNLGDLGLQVTLPTLIPAIALF